jgi:hypothetical protein
VRSGVPAAAWAEQQVASVRDDPAGRITLMERCCYGPFGKAPRHLPFCRAAMSFMRWQLRRGVLQPPFSDRPGSPWWCAVNERILRDGCEAVGLSGNLAGPASSRTVDYWMSFADYPTARAWYRAHNGERGRHLPRAPRPGGGGERGPALLHERRAVPGALHPRHGRRSADVTWVASSARPVPR